MRSSSRTYQALHCTYLQANSCTINSWLWTTTILYHIFYESRKNIYISPWRKAMISFLLTSSLAISSADHFLSTTILKIFFLYFSFPWKKMCGSSDMCVCELNCPKKIKLAKIYFYPNLLITWERDTGSIFFALWKEGEWGITFIKTSILRKWSFKREKSLPSISFQLVVQIIIFYSNQ